MEDSDEVEFQGSGKLEFMEDEESKEAENSVDKLPQSRDNIKLTVKTCKKEGNDWVYDVQLDVNGETKVVQRRYKDIIWLHKSLALQVELGGNILPPLPDPPNLFADLPAANVIGSEGEVMFGGLSRRYCLPMEYFLRELAEHQFFAENHLVHSYLVDEELILPEKLGAGAVWSQLTKVVSDHQLASVQDPDERFEHVLKIVNEMQTKLSDCSHAFLQYIVAWQKLAVQIEVIRGHLHESVSTEKRIGKEQAALSSLMVEGLLEVSLHASAASFDTGLSINFIIHHQHLYFAEAKHMLLRRLSRLHTFQQAAHQLDKAKAEKKEAAEKAMNKAKQAFNHIAETAWDEVVAFQKQYRSNLRNAIMSYAESQVAHSKKLLENLTRIRDSMLGLLDVEE